MPRRPAATSAARKKRRSRKATPRAGARILGFGTAIGLGAVIAVIVAIAIAASSALSQRSTSVADALSAASNGDGTSVTCPRVAPVQVGEVSVPAGPVAGYCQDRLINAAHIINAAKALGIGTHTQAIGVMTAMGESSLVNVDHGDAAGPDSRGLFQQRANGVWGSYTDRMTPYVAATHFFEKLVKIPGWKTLTPTLAAHEVQVNADPNHYAPYWPAAVAVVMALNPHDPNG